MNELAIAVAEGEVLTAADRVTVLAFPRPFESRRLMRTFPAGASVAEMLEEARDALELPEALWVLIDGELVPTAMLARVRPKAGAVVTVRAALHGGGQVLRSVLGLAIAVAALVVAPYLVGALGITAAAGFSAGFISGATALVGGVIAVGGTLALNALFPVRPAQLASNAAAGGAFTQLASIQGARNQAQPYEAIPVVLGTHRMSPAYAAKPYTELLGDDQYLRLLFCWGYGPLSIDVSSLKIGETPLSSFADYEIETIGGEVGDPALTLYPSQVDEQSLAVELTSTAGDGETLIDADVTWFSRTTAPDCDRISIDITYPEGISALDTTTGNFAAYTSAARAQYRVSGSGGAWTDLVRDLGGTMRSLETKRLGAAVDVARGQYEVRVGKATKTASDTATRKDKIVWSALRSFTNDAPIAFPQRLALTALRIKATAQLNGVLDTFNGVISAKVTAYNGSSWVANTVSSNPADLFRHVLQHAANARTSADSEIDLDNLADWWGYCVAQGFTFNQVRGRSSVYNTLADIAAAGRAVPTFIDGKRGVVWDRPDDPIVQHFTPRNSWGLSGSRVYARLPHAWRARFINADNGYTDDERTVYDDGFNAGNATLFEAIEFPGVTDPDLIWRHGRFHIAQARLRPEQIVINADWEQLVCTRGDRVRLTHDAMLIGLASGRVKAIAGQVVTLDELVTIENGKTYAVRFRHPDDAVGSFTRSVDVVATGTGETRQLTLSGSLSNVAVGILCAFGETDRDSAVYRVKAIEHQQDLVARLTLVDDAPDIASADTGAIPDYVPNITIPPDPFDLAPQDLQYQEIIDGVGASVRALVRLGWTLPRRGKVSGFEVQSRDDTAAGDWSTFETVPAPRFQSDVPIIAAGIWSFRVRCLFSDGTVSSWTSLLGLNLAGLTFPPGDITNLHQRSVDGQTHLGWDIVADQRVLRYEVRKGTGWDTGLVVGDEVAQPPWPTTGDGTYHVRAYVLSPFATRIYSEATATIAIADSIISRNIIVSRDEQSLGWPGAPAGLDGGVIDGSFVRTDVGEAIDKTWAQEIVDQLAIDGLHVAIYVSPTIVDIGRAAECRFWTEFEAVGVLQGEDFLGGSDVLGSTDFLGSASTRFIRAFPIWRFSSEGEFDIFDPADVFDPADIFAAGVTWEDWVAIASGTRVSRFYQPGLVVITDKADVDATATKFRWFVDVPDRNDDYTALAVPDTGLAVTFYSGGYNATPPAGGTPVPFNGGPNAAPLPHVQRAIVDGTNGDEVKITNLTLAGCTVHVVNAGANQTRSGVNLLIRGY